MAAIFIWQSQGNGGGVWFVSHRILKIHLGCRKPSGSSSVVKRSFPRIFLLVFHGSHASRVVLGEMLRVGSLLEKSSFLCEGAVDAISRVIKFVQVVLNVARNIA